jgi:hypothetical protein
MPAFKYLVVTHSFKWPVIISYLDFHMLLTTEQNVYKHFYMPESLWDLI